MIVELPANSLFSACAERIQVYHAADTSYVGAFAMTTLLRTLVSDDQGQDIAEYAVMVAVILIVVVGTIRLIGTNSTTVFSNAASSIQ